MCAKRGVELSSVSVFLDSYKTPLPVLTTETSWLGGKHLLVKGTYTTHSLVNGIGIQKNNHSNKTSSSVISNPRSKVETYLLTFN